MISEYYTVDSPDRRQDELKKITWNLNKLRDIPNAEVYASAIKEAVSFLAFAGGGYDISGGRFSELSKEQRDIITNPRKEA